jgi:hypothetical protein
VRPRRNLVLSGLLPRTGSYGVAAGEADGDASVSVFFLVEVFFLVVVDFFVAGAVDFFFVVDAVSELDELLVVIDSFLLAHDAIKAAAARTAMEQISDCFIGYWLNERSECPAARTSASINWATQRGSVRLQIFIAPFDHLRGARIHVPRLCHV